jgi:hypothetical protein
MYQDIYDEELENTSDIELIAGEYVPKTLEEEISYGILPI